MKKTLSKVALATTLLAATTTLTLGSGNHKFIVPAYNAVEIIDGDSFKTTENQTIRLDTLDAPELNFCGGLEAKQALSDLISNTPLYIKVLFRDSHNRLISSVYAPQGYVSETMIGGGYAQYLPKQGANPKLKSLGEIARTNKLGIYGAKCSQNTNPDNPKCNIKGNINPENNTKLYHLPSCAQYVNTQIQLFKGDQWFCTEKEAAKAGFIKAPNCTPTPI